MILTITDKDGVLTGPKAAYVHAAMVAAQAVNRAEMQTVGLDVEAHKQRTRDARDKAIAEWNASHPDQGAEPTSAQA